MILYRKIVGHLQIYQCCIAGYIIQTSVLNIAIGFPYQDVLCDHPNFEEVQLVVKKRNPKQKDADVLSFAAHKLLSSQSLSLKLFMDVFDVDLVMLSNVTMYYREKGWLTSKSGEEGYLQAFREMYKLRVTIKQVKVSGFVQNGVENKVFDQFVCGYQALGNQYSLVTKQKIENNTRSISQIQANLFQYQTHIELYRPKRIKTLTKQALDILLMCRNLSKSRTSAFSVLDKCIHEQHVNEQVLKQSYVYLENIYYFKKDSVSHQAVLTKLLQMDPENVEYLVRRIQIYLCNNETVLAGKTIATLPSDRLITKELQLRLSLMENKKLSKIQDKCNKIIKYLYDNKMDQTNSVPFRSIKAEIFIRQVRYDQAELELKAMDTIVRTAVSNCTSYDRGRVVLEGKQLEVLNNLGNLYYKMGKYGNSKSIFQQIIKKNTAYTNNPVIRQKIKVIEEKAGARKIIGQSSIPAIIKNPQVVQMYKSLLNQSATNKEQILFKLSDLVDKQLEVLEQDYQGYQQKCLRYSELRTIQLYLASRLQSNAVVEQGSPFAIHSVNLKFTISLIHVLTSEDITVRLEHLQILRDKIPELKGQFVKMIADIQNQLSLEKENLIGDIRPESDQALSETNFVTKMWFSMEQRKRNHSNQANQDTILPLVQMYNLHKQSSKVAYNQLVVQQSNLNWSDMDLAELRTHLISLSRCKGYSHPQVLALVLYTANVYYSKWNYYMSLLFYVFYLSNQTLPQEMFPRLRECYHKMVVQQYQKDLSWETNISMLLERIPIVDKERANMIYVSLTNDIHYQQ